MEKSTVLARIRFSLSFTEETQGWLNRAANHQMWFARKGGDLFFSEFSGKWRETLSATISPEIDSYFRGLEISSDHMPRIEFGEEYAGSWIIDLAIAMVGPVGTAYAVLKGVSDLPKIAEGLSSMRGSLTHKLEGAFNRQAGALLRQIYDDSLTSLDIAQFKVSGPPALESPIPPPPLPPPPPPNPVNVGFTIDARPLQSITPAALKFHAMHLSVAVSRDSFVVENLGTDTMTDIRIGVFRTPQERNQWSYEDSFTGIIPLLSGGQTVTKRMPEFRSRGSALDFSDGDPSYVDCWIQDNHGIYLFRFFLDRA